jgi:hypothetical protein
MPKIQTSCPQCQQPLVAEIYQVVDGMKDPRLKELLLAGGLNLAACQICGFQGQLPVPLVYHDADKELLLTFNPPDASKTMEEKESILAPLLKDVTESLDPEDRKGYLFQPQAMLTMNNLVKNVLMGDGITEEMIQKQQDKMSLLDQLFTASGEQLIAIVKEKNQEIDREFFALFAEIAQRILSSQDEQSIKKIQELQDALMAETDVGKEIFKESQEIQAARQSLEALGQNLTRESLLELVINAPTTERLQAMASLVRPAMDYEFFQMFTDRIEGGKDDSRNDLIEKRNLLLKVTQEIDQEMNNRINEARELIDQIIQQESVEDALMNNIQSVDQFFIQALSGEIELAESNQDEDRRNKLASLLQVIQEITTPPELKVLDLLIEKADNANELQEEVQRVDEGVMQKLIDYVTSIIGQYEERMQDSTVEEKEELESTLNKIRIVYSALLKHSMKQKISKE